MQNNRKEELKNAGFNLETFISMGLPSGAKVTVDLPNGQKHEIEVVLERLANMDAIRKDPYYSRWTMAQVFKILKEEKSVTEYLKGKFGHPYRYQFTQTLERLKEINKLPAGEERKKILGYFFTPSLALKLAKEYMENLHAYIDSLPEHKHRGVPYKKIKGVGDVHCKDIEGVVFRSLEKDYEKMDMTSHRAPYQFTVAFAHFINDMVKIPDGNLSLNPAFIAAYQGRGAYLTLVGLIQFHGCRVFNRRPARYSWVRGEKAEPMTKTESLDAVKEKVTELLNETHYWKNFVPDWYKLWGMMKEVVEDNGFDFYRTMDQKYHR